jgi:hypothetical protein
MESPERPCEPSVEQMWQAFVNTATLAFSDIDEDDLKSMRAVFYTGAASLYAYLFQNDTLPGPDYVKAIGKQLMAMGEHLKDMTEECDCPRCTVERAAVKQAPELFRDDN